MTRFLFGLVVGVLGYWAYERDLLPSQVSEVLEGLLSSVGLGRGQPAQESGSSIIQPTPQEVAGRPSEPIPGSNV
jgi:hypothetical protein